MQPGPHRTYLRFWLFTALTAIGAISAFNLVVDPYGVYGLVEQDGFNRIKVRAQQRGLLSKTYSLERAAPHALILGNSRAEIGFDPAHPGWPPEARPAYNYALPGVGIATNLGQLADALRLAPVRIIVLGIDFRDFTFDAGKAGPAAATATAEAATIAAAPGWTKRVRDYAETLLSIDTLGDSIRTVLAQRSPYAARVTALGFNPMLDYVPLAKAHGYHALFDQKNREYARSFQRGGKDIFLPGGRDSPDFATLRALLARCRDAKVELQLVVYPYHAHMLELFRAAGLWDSFEEWKRRVVQMLDEEAAASGAAQRFQLWDFSGYSPATTEDVSAPGDLRSELRWYWEAGHFKKELGDHMLDRILGYRGQRRGSPADFGVLLTRVNIEEHLARIREQRESYAAGHRGEVSHLIRLVDSSR